jgi:hypothetical protein
MVTTLTPEQEALIPVYREKWEAIALSTTPIDRQKAEAAVKAAYAVLGKKEPEIHFFSNPNTARWEALKHLFSYREALMQIFAQQQVGGQLSASEQEALAQLLFPIRRLILENSSTLLTQGVLSQQVLSQLHGQMMLPHHAQRMFLLMWQPGEQLLTQLWELQQEFLREQLRKLPGGQPLIQLGDSLWNQWVEPLWTQLEEPLWKPLMSQPLIQSWEQQLKQPLIQAAEALWLMTGMVQLSTDLFASPSMIDLCISVLDCPFDRRKWEAYQSLLCECGLIFDFEDTCFVCDRPIKFSVDNEHRPHAEGEPAIQFADGFSIWAYHGVRLPETYGKLHPNQWQAKWLLEERNAELRRVLIQGIGYSRICQDLQATEIDTWREYTLLKINSDIDVEPIHLLKMTCPSTGFIHAMRVPPNVTSAREAIRWVNWGTDPEEFSVQT